MLNSVLYGTFLKKFTLPTRDFQSLATTVPKQALVDTHNIDFSHLLSYIQDLEILKDTSLVSRRSYYSLSWLKEIPSSIEENDRQSILQYLGKFLSNIENFNVISWDMNYLSARIMNMLICSDNLFNNYEMSLIKNQYFKSALQQSIFLRKKLKLYKKQREYILFVIRSAYASICFLEERPSLKSTMLELEKLLNNSFNSEGGHYSRSPSFQLKIVDELILLRDLAVNAGISLPTNIQSIIALSSDYLNFMRHPDGGLAVFNGGYESDSDFIDHIFLKDAHSSKLNKINKLRESGYYKLSAEKLTLLCDMQMDKPKNTSDYQGPLSFELSIGNQRVFVNCGCGEELGEDWIQALKLPAAHTMPIIDIDTLRISNKDPNVTPKKISQTSMIVNGQGTSIEGAQSYEFNKTGHIVHQRQITLFKNGKVVRGEDSFFIASNDKKNHIENPECIIRFHLAPNIKARASSTSVMLTIPGQQDDWMFTVGSGKTVLEKSIYLGAGRPQETSQIVARISLNKPNVKFRWTVQELSQQQSKKNKSKSNTPPIEVEAEKEFEQVDETI